MPEQNDGKIKFPNILTHEEILAAAKKDLDEDPKRLQDAMDTLRKWISQSPHLQNINHDDFVLKAFIRGCKYSLEKAKEKLDFFFTVRTTLPDWFEDWDPALPATKNFLERGVYLPLPGYDKQGRFVILMRPGKQDPTFMKIEEGFKVSTMLIELALRNNDQAQVKGFVIIQDMSEMHSGHVSLLTPAIAKKAMTVWQDSSPQNPKAMHVLNMPGIMESLFRMVQSLQKEKLRKRNQIHPKGDYSKMIEDVGLDVLPKDYGGNNVSCEQLTKYWQKEAEANTDWFIQQTKYKTDEKKRPGKAKTHGDIFGIEGSFRKLEID